ASRSRARSTGTAHGPARPAVTRSATARWSASGPARSGRWALPSTCASTTTRWSRAATPRSTCWRRTSIATSPRRAPETGASARRQRAPRDDHRPDHAAAEQRALQPGGHHLADRPEPQLAEQRADRVEPQSGLRESPREQVEAPCHEPPAGKRDSHARKSPGECGKARAEPESRAPLSPAEPGSESDDTAEHQPLRRARNARRRVAEEQVQGVHAQQLDHRSGQQAPLGGLLTGAVVKLLGVDTLNLL